MALTSGQLEAIRSSLGLDANVPDSDIEELAGTKAGMAMLEKIKGQGQEGIGSRIMTFLKGGAHGLQEAKGTKGLEKLFQGVSGTTPKKADPKKKPAAGGTSEADALKQLAQWLTTNYTEQGALAMGQQGQELAQQNQYVTSLVDQQFQQAGAASGNPAVAAAMDAYTKAYSGGEALNSLAYANMGNANAQYLSQSPLYPIANLLTQGFGSTQYKELPPGVVQALPANVQAALSQAGITESSPAGGSGTPIPVAKGASSGGATNLAQILGLTGGATNPNINTSLNQTLSTGAPSNVTS